VLSPQSLVYKHDEVEGGNSAARLCGRASLVQDRLSMLYVRKIFSVKMAVRSAALLVALASAHGKAEAPATLAAFELLQPGLWEFKSTQDGAANRSICLRDSKAMLQLKHFQQSCSQFVIANGPRAATVHYQCNGAGHGQTSVRVETPRLVQLQSQGLSNRAPFSFSAEGRRIGDCSTAHSLRR
jgi:hypothetical protein